MGARLRKWSKVVYERAEGALLVLVLLSAPLQLRLFLFGPTTPQEASAGAAFYEWLSGFFYLSDVPILLLLGLWLFKSIRKQARVPLDAVTLLVALGVGAAIATNLWAVAPLVTAYRNLKLVEMFLLFLWARQARASTSLIVATLVGVGLFESALAWVQFALQRSVGLSWIAESPISPLRTEVAEITVSTGRFVRAYGTLPSPNVLAFFLMLALLGALFLYLRARISLVAFVPIIFTLSMGLALTFSRGVALIGAVAVLVFLALSWRQEAARWALIVLFACAVGVGAVVGVEWYERLFVGVHDDFAVSERVQLNETAVFGISQTPWGIGTGGFTAIHHTLNQPIHNIFLLGAVESGPIFAYALAALLFYALYVQLTTKHPEHPFWVPLLILVIGVGLIDHFLLTLQQGMVAFWVLVGMSLGAIMRAHE